MLNVYQLSTLSHLQTIPLIGEELECVLVVPFSLTAVGNSSSRKRSSIDPMSAGNSYLLLAGGSSGKVKVILFFVSNDYSHCQFTHLQEVLIPSARGVGVRQLLLGSSRDDPSLVVVTKDNSLLEATLQLPSGAVRSESWEDISHAVRELDQESRGLVRLKKHGKHVCGHMDDVLDIKLLPQQRLALVTNTAVIRVLDSRSFSVWDIVEGHEDIVLAVDASPSGYVLSTTTAHARFEAGTEECVNASHARARSKSVAISIAVKTGVYGSSPARGGKHTESDVREIDPQNAGAVSSLRRCCVFTRCW